VGTSWWVGQDLHLALLDWITICGATELGVNQLLQLLLETYIAFCSLAIGFESVGALLTLSIRARCACIRIS